MCFIWLFVVITVTDNIICHIAPFARQDEVEFLNTDNIYSISLHIVTVRASNAGIVAIEKCAADFTCGYARNWRHPVTFTGNSLIKNLNNCSEIEIITGLFRGDTNEPRIL